HRHDCRTQQSALLAWRRAEHSPPSSCTKPEVTLTARSAWLYGERRRSPTPRRWCSECNRGALAAFGASALLAVNIVITHLRRREYALLADESETPRANRYPRSEREVDNHHQTGERHNAECLDV